MMTPEIQKLIEDGRERVMVVHEYCTGTEENPDTRLADALEVAVEAIGATVMRLEQYTDGGRYGTSFEKNLLVFFKEKLAEIQKIAEGEE